MNSDMQSNYDHVVHVPLGERAYDILIGPDLISHAGGEISARLKGRKAAIVTDEHVAPLYLDALMDGLQTRWQLDDDAVRSLLDEAREEAEGATDYFQFTRPLRDHWSAEQRAALIEDMWAIAHADGQTHPREEFVIRKVADLLYVPHSVFIRARHSASG